MSELKIPQNLEQAIIENKIILFIGAGLSKSVGLPSWKEIVIETLKNPSIDKGPSFITAINDEILTPLEALDKIEGVAKKEIFATFEKLTSTNIDSPIHKKLTKISGKIVTTNYDCLIEQNCQLSALSPTSAYSLSKIDEKSEFVLKIHGSCNEIDNAVIFTIDYEKLYGEQNGLAKFQLEKLISTHTCLFIGFSMADHYVSRLFDRLNTMYQGLGRDHYAISIDNIDHPSVKTVRINSYDEISAIIDNLGKLRSSAKNVTNLDKCNEGTATITHPTEENKSSLTQSLDDGIPINFGSDAPPIIENWTGRAEELRALSSPYKVCFITGIGGQGKSALASRLIQELSSESYEFLDWRDFKEEDLNLQSKLYQLIELVSARSITTKKLIGLENDQLVDTFFEALGKNRGLFVFDNIDKYIDLETFTPTGDIAYFFNKALKSPHNSKFVFTCRPFIHHAGIGFYQVQLEGLEFDDVKDLIQKYHQNISSDHLHNLAIRLHAATQGHPLWMGLILAQSRSSIAEMDEILNKISTHHNSSANANLSALISRTILEDVWGKLKDREKIILRTLSISSIAEKEDDLAKIVEKKLNYNQFSKAMKSLRSFNLIVAKEGDGYIELHPLVREFIKANYALEQQENFIALYVSYLDGFLCLIKNKLGRILDPDDIDLVIKKIEILINSDKYSDAANELRLTADSFRLSGYYEEFLRLCDLLLSKNIWSTKKISAIPGFHDLINDFFVSSANYGRNDLFDKHLESYLVVFPRADKNMILAKSALCYREWTNGNYTGAIKEGKSAADLISVLGCEDIWAGLHHYNLALRDSGEPDNIKKALKFFCGTKDLKFYLSNVISDEISGTTYGNIGRCLLGLGHQNHALFLICKSYKSLKDCGISFNSSHNLGYAAKWIHEIVHSKQKQNESIYFILHAINIWENDIPEEANKLRLVFSKTPANAVTQSIASLETWQISKYCDDWVNSFYNDHADDFGNASELDL